MNIESLSLEKFRLSQSFNTSVGVKKQLSTIPVRKPNKTGFIRVKLQEVGEAYECYVLENKEMDETYLIIPELAEEIQHELTPKRLYLAIDKQNNIFIWPVKLPDESGKLDHWNESAHVAAASAINQWVRINANRTLGAYDIYTAIGNLKDPEWPELSFEEILNIAFKGKIISSFDHPVLRKLRGEI